MLRIPFILLLNLYGLVRWGLGRLVYAIVMAFRRRRRYVKIALKGDYPFGQPRGFTQFFRTETTFLDFRKDIKRLADDPDVAGIVLEPGKATLGAARNAAMLELLDSLRLAGKHVVSQADMLQTRDYLESTAADDLLVTPAGRLYTFGPRFESYFLASAFEKHGVDAQFIHIGEYKAAANRFIRSGMSSAQRHMMTDLRHGIVERWRARISDRRRLPPEQVDQLFTRSPMDPRTAIRAGFVDGEAFAEDLADWLETRTEHAHIRPGQSDEPGSVVLTFEEWKSARPKPYRWRPLLRGRRKIAVVDLSGFIIMPGMQVPGANSVIDPDDLIPVLRRLQNDRRVAAVIVHINSPGGSALASDLIWKAVDDLRATKPVVAYCTDVAASGGYYIAVGADKIICHPETVTGSIGVVIGKLSAGEALHDFGVDVEAIGDEGSEFLSIWEPLGERVLDNLMQDTRSFYRRFLQRVGRARRIERRRLHRFARGRVYLGDQALQRGLVDGLGGWNAAVDAARELCAAEGVTLAEDPPIEFVAHRRQSLKDTLRKSAVEATGTAQLLDPLLMISLMRRDPVLALLPWRIH